MWEQDGVAHWQNRQRPLGGFVRSLVGSSNNRIAHDLSLSDFHSTLDDSNWQKDANLRARLLNSRPFPAFCKTRKGFIPSPVTWFGACPLLRSKLRSQSTPNGTESAVHLLTPACDE